MNRVLTASSLLAASLAFIPTASQAQSQVKFMNIMDASAVHEKTGDLFRLNGYEGPVVIVQTERKEELPSGYVAMMTFSESALGPIEDHPILDLVNGEDLEGAPMFLTDRIDSRKLIDSGEIPTNPENVAGVIDLQWAADEIFDDLNDGIGEGDFLVVTRDFVGATHSDSGITEVGSSQSLYAAFVFDPEGVNVAGIEAQAGLNFHERSAYAVLLERDGRQLAAGFTADIQPLWVANGPADSDKNSDNSGTNSGMGGVEKEEDSQREDVVDGRSTEVPENLGGSVDLPEFTPSPRSPVREGGRFAPATHRAPYRG
jgi:hypothetical protein